MVVRQTLPTLDELKITKSSYYLCTKGSCKVLSHHHFDPVSCSDMICSSLYSIISNVLCQWRILVNFVTRKVNKDKNIKTGTKVS